MKKTYLFILYLMLSVCGLVRSQTFVHPGVPLSKSDLDILKAHVQAGDYPWKQAYDIMAADGKSQLTYTMQGPFATVSRSPDLNRNQWANDMAAAFNLSLMWYFTGNQDYAIKARDILVAWATTQTEFTGQLGGLDIGDYAYAYGGAASILRGTWNGWTAANTAAVQNLFNNVYWAPAGCAGYALGPANKGTLSISAGAVIAAFSDDPAKIAHIVHLARYIGSTGLKNTLPSGQNGESLRDQGHAHGTWNNLAFAAEVLYKQGIDIYSDLEDRIMANAEYFSRKNLGLPMVYIPYGTTDFYYLNDLTTPWDQGRLGPTLAYGAYVVRKKQSSVYLTKLLNTISRRFDPVYTWFYKSEDNSTATVPAQTQIVPEPTKVGTGGLTSLDIGSVSAAGSSSYTNNVWTVRGSGAEILTHSADAFHFVYKQVTGNCSIIAKVETVGGSALNARAGLMIRSDLTSASAQRAWIAIKSGKRAESFMHGWTEMRGGSNWEKPERTIPQDSYWVKIERLGDVIVTYYSPDGTSWAAECQGRYEGFTGTAYIGLAVCANANGVLDTATFSNVSVTGGQGGVVTVPEAPHSIYAYPGNNQNRLRWLSSFGADSYTLKLASSENGPYTTIASNLPGNSFLDAGAANGQAYYYKVCAVNSAGTSADSPSDAGIPEAPPVPQILSSDALNGVYRIIASHSNKAVEVKNGSTAEGALLGQKTYAYLSNQHWIINPVSGTDYKIINLFSGKAMDVVGNAITNGALIEQRSYSSTDSAQVWTIKDRQNGTFSIVGKQSQKALNVPGSNTSDGVSMELNRWLDDSNQVYKIEPVPASEMTSAYLQKLAEAIKLRDTTQTSATNVSGKFPVTANAQLNDSITYIQSLYNAQSTVVQVSGYVTVLDNAIKRYKASMYYQLNTLADGNYYLKPLGSDSLWTRNTTNTPLFDVVNPDPLLQMWNVKKQGNGRYRISCLSAPPASFSNYLSEGAQFGRNVTPYSDAWNSMNLYFDGASYAIQRAQNAGNGYWYKSGNTILTIGGSDNDPVPYSFPFRFVPVGTVPVNLIVAAGDGKNILEWDPIYDLTYTIKRSTTPGGPYTTIANQSTPGFTDTNVSNGTTYYYVVVSPDGVASSPEVVAAPNVGQMAYLKFDETSGTRLIDTWGAIHGTLQATATRSTGKSGNSINLDGSANAYASLPTGIVSALTDFTISTWIKVDAKSNSMRVFDFGTGTDKYMFLTIQGGAANVMRYGIRNGGAELQVNSNYTLPLNTWTHFAITQLGNTCSMYINGALVATNTGVNIKPSTLGSTNQNYIGKSQWSVDPLLKGSIDEFKIYSRALSASELAESMKVSQVITLNAAAGKLLGDADFEPATVSSGLAVSYTSSNSSVATIVNGKVHLVGTGTTTITASQAGDNSYWPATSQTQVLTVAITNNTAVSAVMGTPFSYTITNNTNLNNFTASGLPAGLSLNTSTGVISGTPTVYGAFSVALTASNGSISGSQTITLTVSSIVNNVIASAGDAKNILEWDAILNSTYNVKRSTTSGGPYTTLGTLSGTTYTDTNVTNGSTYYYVVSANNTLGENPNSVEVTAAPNAGQFTYLKFDEASGTRGVDSWGTTHATLQATATRDAGRSGTALKLDGTSTAYATLPAGIVSTLNDFTISTWVRMDVKSNWMRVFDFGSGTTKYMFLTIQAGSANVMRYAIKNGGGEQQLSFNYTLPLNTWTHFAITQSGNTCTMYINGTAVASNTGVTIKPSTIGSTTQNYLGKSQFNDPMFKGSIDEFKIFGRALTASEIAASHLSQTITLAATAEKTLGAADFEPATISSGLPVTYSSSNESVASIVNGKVHPVAVGTATITASQPGNGVYWPAQSQTQVLTVKQAQTVNFAAIGTKLLGDADFNPAATASSGLAVSYASSNTSVATIVNGKVHLVGTGTATITASQAGDNTYAAATSQTQVLTVILTNNTAVSAVMGTPFTYTITNSTSLNSFTATGLPAGLSVNTSTGVISGTPTVYGTFLVALTASNGSISGSQTIMITVFSVVNNVMVASGDAKNILEWDAIQNVTYNIKRSTTSGGPYTTLGTLSGTSYTDVNVTNGSTYYYVISANNTLGENQNSAEVTATPNAGQFTYLKFDEASGTRGTDSWGANHATLQATATRDAGLSGTALKLDGTSTAYATLPAGIVSTLTDFTISTWVRMDVKSNWMRVFDFGTGTSKYMFLTIQAGSANVMRYAIKNGGSEQQVSFNYTLPLNTWTHFAITQSGNTCTMYINGTAVATNTGVTINPSTIGSTTQNYLGKSQYNDPMFKGSMDGFKIYSRALSAAEIQNFTTNQIAQKADETLKSDWGSDRARVNNTLIYPNPVVDNRFTIATTSELIGKYVTLKLIDLMGRTVYSKTVKNDTGNVDVVLNQALPGGIYTLILNNQYSGKVIIK